jgi:hypothetical protein
MSLRTVILSSTTWMVILKPRPAVVSYLVTSAFVR